MAETIILTSQNNHGISYSDDNGTSFTLSNITTGSFDKAIYNNNGIAVTRALDKGNSNIQGILYSEDGGATWTSLLDSYWFTEIVHLNNDLMFTCEKDSGHTYYTRNGKDWEIASNLTEEYLISQRRLDLQWEQNLAAHCDTGRNLQTVFGCSTLQETCQLLQEKSNNRDYSGLSPCGDYIELPNLEFGGINYLANPDTQTLRFVVAGLGIYDGVGDTASDPSIIFIEKNVLCQSRMHSSTSSLPAFHQTELGLKCADAVAGVEATLGVTLKTVRRLYDAGSNNSSSPWLDFKAEKLFIPTEREVFLDSPWSNDWRTYSTGIIWPIFSKCPQSRIKYHQTNVGERRWWWTANKSSTSGCFTLVDSRGIASCGDATYTHFSVVLAFAI